MSCVWLVLAESIAAIAGSEGRYMSVESGPSAVSSARTIGQGERVALEHEGRSAMKVAAGIRRNGGVSRIRQLLAVITGLVPVIPISLRGTVLSDRDGRDEPGHDQRGFHPNRCSALP